MPLPPAAASDTSEFPPLRDHWFFSAAVLPYAALAAVTAAVFWPCLNAGYFNWDDYRILHASAELKTPGSLRGAFSSFIVGHYHPFTTLSFAFENILFGHRPWVSHLINILLHFINAALVFRLVTALLSDRRKGFLAAVVFAVHPMHVESVAWVAERKDVLYSVFYLSALWLYFKRCVSAVGKARVAPLALVFVLFVCALLSKSMAMTLPPVLLLLDWRYGSKITLSRVLEKIPFFALATLAGLLAVHTQGKAGYAASFSLAKFAGGICLASGNALFYLLKFVVPFNLSVFYPFPGSGVYSVPPAYYAAPFALAAVLWVLLRFSGRVTPLAGFGIMFFAVTIMPCLQLLPVGLSLAADHYTYIPYLGLIIPFTDALFNVVACTGGRVRKLIMTLAAVWLLVVAGAAMARCFVWRDSVTLWSDALARYPQSVVAFTNRGLAYSKAGWYDKAVEDFAAAHRLDPRSALCLSNLSAALARAGNPSAALRYAMAAAELEPGNPDPLVNLGNIYLMLGQPDKAREFYIRALRLSPDHAEANYNLKQLQ